LDNQKGLRVEWAEQAEYMKHEELHDTRFDTVNGKDEMHEEQDRQSD